jgi:hypothetical protein
MYFLLDNPSSEADDDRGCLEAYLPNKEGLQNHRNTDFPPEGPSVCRLVTITLMLRIIGLNLLPRKTSIGEPSLEANGIENL